MFIKSAKWFVATKMKRLKKNCLTPNYLRARHPGGIPKGYAAHGKAGGDLK